MRENKDVYATKRDIKKHREYQTSTNRVLRTREYSVDRVRCEINTQEVGCQHDTKRDNIICTCKNIPIGRRWQEIRYFNGLPKQIYTYHGLRSYTDTGVSSVKTLPRRRVKRVYLPETVDRGVGSSELAPLFRNRRTTQNKDGSYYDHKKTSSKCVGGVIEYNTGCVTSAKLSPIIHTRSGTTSPTVLMHKKKSAEISSNTVEKYLITIKTQVEDEYFTKEVNKEVKKPEDLTPAKEISEQNSEMKKSNKSVTHELDKDKSRITRRIKEPEKSISSDSLVQNVHNLEMPSDDKSHMSLDPMENKLEREYRKMFLIQSKESKPSSEKPITDFKSTSMLRRRFEALRRGVVKKEDCKNIPMIDTKISHTSVPSCKDVSIASDPPSLEGRSYSNTKTYSPFQSNADYNKDIYNPSTSYKKSFTEKKEQDYAQWPRTERYDEDSQGVKGMFKIWGKKFNLEESSYNKTIPKGSCDIPKIIEKKPEAVKPKPEPQEKKEGRKFFFFKRKSKDKNKQPYKSKKGVTAGRCEVGDGLMIKIGAAGSYNTEEIKQPNIVSSEYEEILRKAWLTKYLSHKIDSRKSVQVRWNNKTYATSSSTIFELMDDVYKEAGVVFKSMSEITTGESSYYKSYTKQHVNFMQNIEAWMIPKTIRDRPGDLTLKKYSDNRDEIEVSISDQKWFIEKSKAFSHNIEVVLHCNNFVKMNKRTSSEYLRIDIPKGFFVESCSEEEDRPNQSSIEEVYKIVEYESTTDLKKQRNIVRKLDKGDEASKDIKVTISVKDSKYIESKILETVIKTPPVHRDVVIQGSNVYIPKRCDVIGTGIITRRDFDLTKPILNIQDNEMSVEESEPIMQINPKKCEFAESYLQDYYRNWTYLGIDLSSWCVSDSHLRCCSEHSRTSFNYQGDGSKSCPNIYDDFHASTVYSSCATSSCSHCNTYEGEQSDKTFTSKLINKLKKKTKENSNKRCLPKDSLEVFKKRLIYAQSNKGNWGTADDKPYSVPSIDNKYAQKDIMIECPKTKKPCNKSLKASKKEKKERTKHVSLHDGETMNDIRLKLDEMPEGMLTFKRIGECDISKNLTKGVKCPKHTTIDPTSPCKIVFPPCMPECKKPVKLACVKPNSPSCNVSPPCTLPCEAPPEIPCACPSSTSSLGSCPMPPCVSPPSSSPLLCSSSSCSTPPPKPSEIKLSSSRHTPPYKSSPPPCIKSPPLCPNSPPPCMKSSNPCPTSSPPYTKPLSPCPEPPPPSMKLPPPCPKSPPIRMKSPNPCPNPPSPYTKPLSPCPKPPSHSMKLNPPCPRSPPTSIKPPPPSLKPTPSCQKSPPPCPKSPSVCIKPSPPSPPQLSSRTVATNDCKPDCVNRKRSQSPRCPATQKEYPNNSKSKISGLFLKMVSSKKKTCPKEGPAGNSPNDLQDGVIRLNSKESILIRIKKETPSTEEIREGMDIKVQDFDGKTLYERRNYREGGCRNKAAELGDMYIDSNVQMSAPFIVENVTSETQGHDEATEGKSNASTTNVVEIQFKLRVTQGDKTTEINVGNDKNNDSEKIDKSNRHHTSSQGIYAVKHEGVHSGEDLNPNNDINIRIVIQNYKPQNRTTNVGKCNDDFSKKISDKFHTVSTGYSDLLQNADNVYSIRQTTLGMTASTDKFQNKTSDEVMAEELVDREPINHMLLSHSTKSDTDQLEKIEEDIAEKGISSSGQIKELELSELSRSQYGFKYDNFDATDTDQDLALDLNTSYENNGDSDEKVINPHSKIEKKEMLKNLFEKVHNTKTDNKKKVKKLRDMLKQILTSDSSGHEDMAHVTSNELAKEVTYASLKPNYFRGTDSMNNYYKSDSTFTYPTKENNSLCSSNSDNDIKSTNNIDLIHQSCMCSVLAARLNICEIGDDRGCCCRANPKKNEETICDLRNDEDFYLLNYKATDYADVETQNSSYLTRIMNRNHVAVNVVDLKETQDKITLTNIFCPHKNHIKDCEMMKLNRNTTLSISDEDKIVVLETKETNLIQEQSKVKDEKDTNEKRKEKKHKKKTARVVQGADILQLYETKKAVLEIYAQKTISDGTEHIVAKLPKFAYDRESDIRRNYEEIVENGSINR